MPNTRRIDISYICNLAIQGQTMKVDILAVGVHPDDIELSCSGTLFKHIEKGRTVALCDLTQGELGSRGSAELRLQEAERAREIFQIEHRINLGLADGFFRKDKESLLELIKVIRAYKPTVVLANAIRDRHPDHGRAADFIKEACFLAGLLKIETEQDGHHQTHWRPMAVYHYIQDFWIEPDFIVDISEHMGKKMESIHAYGSQFFNPTNSGPETPISGKAFLDHIEGRARHFGRLIGVEFAEGFTTNRPIGVQDLLDII